MLLYKHFIMLIIVIAILINELYLSDLISVRKLAKIYDACPNKILISLV